MSLTRTFAAWGLNVAIALVALRTNLMRSILTTLGVMIGVLAVILAVAVGDGAKVSVLDSINQLGSNMAIVFPQPENTGGRRVDDRGRLTERDAAAIKRLVPGVSGLSPQLRATVQIVIQGRNATTTAAGITPDYAMVSNSAIDTGRFIVDADVRTAARVVVLGPSVATKLFGSFDPLGQTVRIARVPFVVVGVLETKGSSFGTDNDDLVLVPITAARQRFATLGGQGPDDLAILFVGFDDQVDLAAAKKDIVRVLRDRNNVPKGDISPFTVNTTEEFMEQTGTVTAVFQGVLEIGRAHV